MQSQEIAETVQHSVEKLVLIADSHINGGENQEVFFSMLKALSNLPDKCGIVFLGDIFDLWIALPGYECYSQKKFLLWCKKEKNRRPIYFLEGNHEFFITALRKKFFTGISRGIIHTGNAAFTHGDTINGRDWQYALLRMFVRNPLTASLLMLAAPGGFGPSIAWKIRYFLKESDLFHKKYFPLHFVKKLLKKEWEKHKVSQICSGHFHHLHHVEESNAVFDVIPCFEYNYEIGLYDTDTKTLKIAPHEEIITELTGE